MDGVTGGDHTEKRKEWLLGMTMSCPRVGGEEEEMPELWPRSVDSVGFTMINEVILREKNVQQSQVVFLWRAYLTDWTIEKHCGYLPFRLMKRCTILLRSRHDSW